MVMAKGVVDILEPVQVQQQQGGWAQLAISGPDCLVDAVGEQLPVGQPVSGSCSAWSTSRRW